MDRRHLEYFLAVAEAGSFTRAAARLTIAQPSLSHAVRLLERELGADLFERGGRGVRLTPAGEALVAPARRTLRSFTLAAGAVRGASDTGYGRVRVITNTLWAMDPLVRVVGAFRQVRPGARIVVVDPAHRSDVLEAVRSGEADLGLVGGTPPTGPLATQWLGDQDLVAVVPRARSGLPSPLGVADLVPLGLVTTPPGTALREYVDGLLAAAGLPEEAAVETAHLAAVVPLVAAGAGAALLPVGLAAGLTAGSPGGADAGVEILPLEGAPRTSVHLVWRRDGLPELAAHFLEVARSLHADDRAAARDIVPDYGGSTERA